MTVIRNALAGLAAAAVFVSAQAFADATIVAMKGDVRVGNSPASVNSAVFSGATVTTGPGAQAYLKFDDQQQIVLNENTTFRIADFRYRAAEPRGDRAVFDLLRGALRFITGIVGVRSRNSVALRVPQATIGVRGTDFMVALVNNPAYVNVTHGAIGVTNGGGTAVFGEGAVGQVSSASSLATSIPASSLPAGAAGAFGNLAAAPVAASVTPAVANGAAAGAQSATAAGGISGAATGAVVGVGVGAAIIGGAVHDNPTTATHH